MSSPSVPVTAPDPVADLPVDDGAWLDRVGRELGIVAGRAVWSLADEELLDRVSSAFQLRAQADALLLAAVGEVMLGIWPVGGARPRCGRGCGRRTAATRGRPAG